MDQSVGSPDFPSMDDFDMTEFRTKRDFDLIVIGSGPAGQKAAISAAKKNARVALVEKDPLAGGVCLNTGTIPSKSLREAVIYLTGYRQRGYYGDSYRLKDQIKAGDLLERTNHVLHLERTEINHQLEQNGITRLVGTARLTGPNHIAIKVGEQETEFSAANIILCVGTTTRRPMDVPFDDVNIFDSNAVFGSSNDLRPLPDSIIVLGAGVIGIEYATMFAALEIPTILVDPRENPLSFVDNDISEILYSHLRRSGVELIFGDIYKQVRLEGVPGEFGGRVIVELNSGRTIEADSLLFALGRVPATEPLGVAAAGVALDKRSYVVVDDQYRSSIPSIFAAGDVIGFPSLASTSAEQGRVAALHALGYSASWHPDSIPYGIYTIPEISMVGKTEQQLQEEKTEYFIGTALWRDTARGKILGDLNGALKLIFSRADNRLIGVHIIGEGATELLHIGQAVMHFGGGPEYFRDAVFNYPTLAEAYKIAGHNAINRLAGKSRHNAPLPLQVFSEAPTTDYIPFGQH